MSVVAPEAALTRQLAEVVVRSVPHARLADDDRRDWRDHGDALVLEARRIRVTGPLVAAVDEGWVRLTRAQVELLHQHHLSALSWCLRLEDRLCDVVEAFAAAGLAEPRVVKGPAIAHLDEVDPSLRTFGDLDLLVRAGELDRAVSVLAGMGALRPYAERRPGFDRRFAKSVTATFPDGIEVDVHRTICDGVHALRVPVDRLFERPERFTLAGRSFTAPDATARLLHAAYHAVLGSPEPRLMSLRDLLGYMARTDGAVATVVDEAARWGGTTVLHGAVVAVRSLPGTDLPGWSSWADQLVLDRAEVSIIAAQRRDGSSYGRSRLRVLVDLPSWRDRAAYAHGVLFPSPEHLAERGLRRRSLLRPRRR